MKILWFCALIFLFCIGCTDAQAYNPDLDSGFLEDSGVVLDARTTFEVDGGLGDASIGMDANVDASTVVEIPDAGPPPDASVPLDECEMALWSLMLSSMEEGGFDTTNIQAPMVLWVDSLEESTEWCHSAYPLDSCSRNGWVVVRKNHPSERYVLFHELTQYALARVGVVLRRNDPLWRTLFDPILESDTYASCRIN